MVGKEAVRFLPVTYDRAQWRYFKLSALNEMTKLF